MLIMYLKQSNAFIAQMPSPAPFFRVNPPFLVSNMAVLQSFINSLQVGLILKLGCNDKVLLQCAQLFWNEGFAVGYRLLYAPNNICLLPTFNALCNNVNKVSLLRLYPTSRRLPVWSPVTNIADVGNASRMCCAIIEMLPVVSLITNSRTTWNQLARSLSTSESWQAMATNLPTLKSILM